MADGVAWEIVKRAAGGEEAARQELVETTLDNVWALAMRLTRSRDAAGDVVQETYARAFENLAGLEPNGRFEGYLARIATNLVLEHWRRRRPTLSAADLPASSEADEPWLALADEEEDRRRLSAVWAVVGRLDPRVRAAMLLHYAQGEPYESIGRILNVPVGTLKTWLYRARGEVRRGAEALLRRQPALGRTPSGDAP
jgi:RNA polymerase sigma-70 factor (ECF subfamily)